MSKKVVTETTIVDGSNRVRHGSRMLRPTNKKSYYGKRRHGRHDPALRKRRLTDLGLWKDEWDNCPPSTADCYYYVWNFTYDNYYCPEEGELLSRGLYSKYEIDDFLDDLKKKDLHRADKHPTGWYYFLAGWAMIGVGLIFLSLFYWWKWSDKTSTMYWFWLILGIIIWIIALVLLVCACVYCCRGRRYRVLRRREDMMPVVDNENRRIYHRGLNWRLSELGSYLALRTNYSGPIGGHRRRNPMEEEALLNGSDPHANKLMRDAKHGAKKAKHRTLDAVDPHYRGRSVHSRVASPRSRHVVTEVRASGVSDINSISRSGMNQSQNESALNLNAASPRVSSYLSQKSGSDLSASRVSNSGYKSGLSSPSRKYNNSHLA
jgi:hypothetical protein